MVPGTVLLQVLQNLVNLLGIPSSLNFAVMGGVILLGVIADQELQQRRAQMAAKRPGPSRRRSTVRMARSRRYRSSYCKFAVYLSRQLAHVRQMPRQRRRRRHGRATRCVRPPLPCGPRSCGCWCWRSARRA